MKLIKKLAKMGEDALKGRLLPFTIKKVWRALESAIDSVSANIVELEERVEKLLAKISKGEVDCISEYVGAVFEIKESTAERVELEVLRDKLNAEAPADSEEDSEDGE